MPHSEGLLLTDAIPLPRLKIARLPGYPQFIKLGREREGAIFLDMGCCCEWALFFCFCFL